MGLINTVASSALCKKVWLVIYDRLSFVSDLDIHAEAYNRIENPVFNKVRNRITDRIRVHVEYLEI